MSHSSKQWTRRALLQRAAHLSAMGAATPLALSLAGLGEAAAFDSTDYKALVCIFLYGGNDYANTVVPYDATNYAAYHQIRAGSAGEQEAGIALGRASLAATALTPNGGPALTDNLQYALHPRLTGLKSLWDQGRLAVQLNVGPLVRPTTLAQFNSGSHPLPPKLFSHNDQQSVWQSLSSEGSTVGWGGRMGDLAMSSNATNSLLTCISATGNAVFVAGNSALQYQISPQGAIRVNPMSSGAYYFTTPQMRDAMSALIQQTSSHVLENEYAVVTRRSIQLEGVVNSALQPINLQTSFDTDATPNPLANQLRIVARLLGARNTLGTRRQVFFVSLGGFDNHNLLMQDHPTLMARVNEAMTQFYAATVELGIADKVVTFTSSDFGRTLASNADGSDHGWGSHQFVMGGAVQGGRFYGTAPRVSLNSNDQVGQGRLLPSTSVDEFATTLARWFGVESGSEIAGVLANSNQFAHSNVAFV
jgi:uncharacterized protein (DUF1501 family)